MIFPQILKIAVLATGLLMKGPSAEASNPPEHPAAAVHVGAPTLLIIYAAHLKPAAVEWSAYRASSAGGQWTVVLHEVAADDGPAAQRRDIRAFIREHAGAAQLAVMLLGDAPQSDSSGDAGIATWRFPQPDPVLQSRNPDKEPDYATDHPYQLLDDKDDVPDIALGRVPAQTVEDARGLLEKLRRYESAPPDGALPFRGRNRITYVAGEGHFGVMDNVLESLFKTMVDRLVPDAFDMSMTYAKASSIYCPPPSKLTETVMERMTEGSLLFNYIGHGFERGLDSLRWGRKRFPIMRATDFSRLPAAATDAQLPIAYMSCCSVGWFDLPNGERSFAEEMLLHPTGGAAAVIAGSRITHPYANTVLQMDITRALLGSSNQQSAITGQQTSPKPQAPSTALPSRPLTVGQLDLLAARSLTQIDEVDRELDALAAPIAYAGKWKTSLKGLRQMHVRLYNLLGDPATRIPLPQAAITNLKLENAPTRVSGRIEGMTSGRVWITLETARTSMATPARLIALADGENGADDPELEKKATNNYPLVNERVLVSVEAEVSNGRFEIGLAEPAPQATANLRAYAIGHAADGCRIEAVGGVRLPEMPLPGASPSP